MFFETPIKDSGHLSEKYLADSRLKCPKSDQTTDQRQLTVWCYTTSHGSQQNQVYKKLQAERLRVDASILKNPNSETPWVTRILLEGLPQNKKSVETTSDPQEGAFCSCQSGPTRSAGPARRHSPGRDIVFDLLSFWLLYFCWKIDSVANLPQPKLPVWVSSFTHVASSLLLWPYSGSTAKTLTKAEGEYRLRLLKVTWHICFPYSSHVLFSHIKLVHFARAS